KKELVAVAEGRRTTRVEDGTAVGLGYGIPEQDIFLRHHLEDKVDVKEWGMILPRLGYYYSLLCLGYVFESY
ncbi:hypothetical protein Tco_0638672, partial [Tanacetum coccineum]